MISPAFDKAPPEKQLGVINAGFSCFGETGFQKTSMRDIALAAGISKASLFHYFGTKESLYQFLFHFACQKVGENIPVGTQDFMECISIATRAKFQVLARYPGMYDFLVSVTLDEAPEAENLRQNFNARAAEEASRILFSKVDWSRFREDISPEDAINLVSWVSTGCLKANPKSSQDEILAQVNRYLELLKPAIYKENQDE